MDQKHMIYGSKSWGYGFDMIWRICCWEKRWFSQSLSSMIFPANNYFYLRVLVPLVYLLGAWVHDTALVLDGSIRSEHLYPLGISLTTFKGLWARIENSVAHRIVGHVEDSTITLFGSALQWDWVWNFGSRMGYNGDMIVGCHHISRILRRWWKKNDLWENACKSSGVSLFNHTSD
jgi:hypothetical protein